MKRKLILLKTLAVFVSLSLSLPNPAYGLRQSGIEESKAKTLFLEKLGRPTSTAGMEEGTGKEGIWKQARHLIIAMALIDLGKMAPKLKKFPLPADVRKQASELLHLLAAKQPNRDGVLGVLGALIATLNEFSQMPSFSAQRFNRLRQIIEDLEEAKNIISRNSSQISEWKGPVTPKEAKGFLVGFRWFYQSLVSKEGQEPALRADVLEPVADMLAGPTLLMYGTNKAAMDYMLAHIPYLLAEDQGESSLRQEYTRLDRIQLLGLLAVFTFSRWESGDIYYGMSIPQMRNKILFGVTVQPDASEDFADQMKTFESFPAEVQKDFLDRLLHVLSETSAAGAEEIWRSDFLDILEEAAPQGPGVLVIEAGEISRRTGLEEFVARVPKRFGQKLVLFGEGSSVIQELAARNGIAVVDSDRLVDLAVRLAGMEEAGRIGYVGDPMMAGRLSEMLPASMRVTPLKPGTTLVQMLGYLKYPQGALDAVNAAGAEELFVRARAA